jgi:superfamily II DNA or RNA helicase
MEDVGGHINLALEKEKNLTRMIGDKSLLDHQYFVAKIFLGLKTMNRLLLFWDTGSGKTLASVYIIKHLEELYPEWYIFIFIKASLHNDPWYSTLEKYTPEKLERIFFIHYNAADSHVIFLKRLQEFNQHNRVLFIIDECQNFISQTIQTKNRNQRTKKTYDLIQKMTRKNNKLLLISATPILNEISEFNILASLLRENIKIDEEMIYNNRIISEKELINKMAGCCSYYRPNEIGTLEDTEASDVYPAKRIKFVNVTMSLHQTNIYADATGLDIKAGNTSFKTFRRMAASFAFEKFSSNYQEKVLEFKKDFLNCKFSTNFITSFINNNIQEDEEKEKYDCLYNYSCKFIEACKLILNSEGKCLVYSHFVNYIGIAAFKIYLNCFNISFVQLSSSDSNLDKYNSIENINGNEIKVCLFSGSGAEGVSFTGVNSLIILDIPWSEAKLRQVIGRSIRTNSHKDLDVNRKYVNIYILISEPCKKEIASIDNEMIDLIKRKNDAINILYKLFKKTSIEKIHQYYKTTYSEKEFIFDTLNNLQIDFLNKTDVLVLKKLVPILYSDDNFVTIKNGYYEKETYYVYENQTKIGTIDPLDFNIINEKMVYNLYPEVQDTITSLLSI